MLAFAFLAFSSLFSVINPISAAPLFVSMTEGSAISRRRIALRSCIAAGAILVLFAAAGSAIFTFFGITVPAFQIAGGLLFTLMSIRTLQGEDEQASAEESGADPSVVPLGIPLIAGPGAISVVMVLVGQAQDTSRRIAVGGAIALNILITLLVFLAAPVIVRWLGATGQRIADKVMGLITAVIGIQFMINGLTTVITDILKATR